jgi:hypothetical protein
MWFPTPESITSPYHNIVVLHAFHLYRLRRPGILCVQRISIAEMWQLELLPSFVSALESQPSTRCEIVKAQHKVCQSHCLEGNATTNHDSLGPCHFSRPDFQASRTQDDKIWGPEILPPVVFELPRLHSIAIAVDLENHRGVYWEYDDHDPLPRMPLHFFEELDLQVLCP